MKPIQIPVLVDGLRTLKDGGIKISLETRELPPDSAARVFGLRNREAWAILAPTAQELSGSGVPEEKPDPGLGTKTPSQRLRSVLYVLWQQGGAQGDFESYYNLTMERVIEQFKEKLEPDS